jgi:hydroxyethylthiazole kinase-like uncharacterized protein yjeF
MHLITRQQARVLDRLTMTEYGIAGKILMGNAGQKIAEFIRFQSVNLYEPRIGIVCGKGNNGGDGFATAKNLHNWGFRITVYSLVHYDEIKGDSVFYHDLCKNADIPIFYDIEPPITKPNFDLMVDGLLGIGFTGNIREELFPWIEWLNICDETISIDIPSGINANTGIADIYSVRANHSVTIGYPKLGMTIEPGKSCSGSIHSVDIGFPDILSNLDGRAWISIAESEVKSIIKPLHKSAHKHIQGKVLFIAGSKGMTGAAYLSTMGALRSGAGLTITCAPKSLNAIYEGKITEGMTVACEDKGCGYLSENNFDEIMKWVEWCNVLAIGPGLGKAKETENLVEKLVQAVQKPMVIDADGLRPFYNKMDLFSKIKNEFVITPHTGEMSKLLNVNADILCKDIPEAIEEIMRNFPGVLIAKFAPSLVAWGSKGAVNSTGNPGLATAGSGDVLTGVVASFIAQGFDVVDAAKVATYIHGKAGDQLAKSISQRGMVAGDILYKIGKVLREYEL